jgi:crotonobetainyl-CoA:carnitine CoA-transferase CaiB-like acyl-CoA transferase
VGENSTLWLRHFAPVVPRLTSVVREFTALTGVRVDVQEELTARARLAGLPLPGRVSSGGFCRLLGTGDGWVALNLARPDDRAALAALLGLVGAADGRQESGGEPMAAVARAAAHASSAEFARLAQMVGIPAAALGSERGVRAPVLTRALGDRLPGRVRPVRVVDFSALWAGPLCARLLGLAGAEVTKVESRSRPDGARRGWPDFYARLHAGHSSLVLDFTERELHAVVADADLVIEASRPRALRQFGLRAEEFLAGRPGRVWVSITGYGRADDRIAFGDDAAVAGGLTAPGPAFLGDATADPVTGLYAARAAARALSAGGGSLLDVSMAACAADVAEWAGAPSQAAAAGSPSQVAGPPVGCGQEHR